MTSKSGIVWHIHEAEMSQALYPLAVPIDGAITEDQPSETLGAKMEIANDERMSIRDVEGV